MTRRYIIIIGAMKSGTTTLFDVLARHPAVAPASNKEPGFFAFDEIRARGFEWFDTLFDFDPARHLYRLEASTDYTKAPFVTGVWERMTADPDVEVKLLYIMRHPLRRIESHARHVQNSRKEIGQQVSPRPDHSLDAGLSPVSLAISQYAMQLAAYREALSDNRLHCLTLEDLQTRPRETLAEVYAFLGLEGGEETDAFALPVSNAAADKTELRAAWGRLAAMRPLMAAGRALLPSAARERIKGAFRRPVQTRGRFRLSDAETAMLAGLYCDDLERLRKTYGIATGDVWSL